MSNNKPIQYKLFCEILTKIVFFLKFVCEIFLEYFLAIYLLTANIFGSDLMALSDILSTCTANKSAVWPFLCRLASPKRGRNLTMLWFLTGTTSWWFSISIIVIMTESFYRLFHDSVDKNCIMHF
jgi:hypothetical protein